MIPGTVLLYAFFASIAAVFLEWLWLRLLGPQPMPPSPWYVWVGRILYGIILLYFFWWLLGNGPIRVGA